MTGSKASQPGQLGPWVRVFSRWGLLGLPLRAEWPPASQAGRRVGRADVPGLAGGEGSPVHQPAILALPFLCGESAGLGK